jgi:uncharacterized membrane protein
MRFINHRNLFLAISSSICVILLIIRFQISDNHNYRFLIWNLILAWIPLFISQYLFYKEKIIQNWRTYIVFLSWLIFFPNAPYIVTDFIHLRPKIGVPLWFDLLLIISFVWNGLLLGFASLLDIHCILLKIYTVKKSWCIIISILFLSSYGIYLGRFERLNSWDIIVHPYRLFHHLFSNLTDLDILQRIIGVTFGFGLFLIFSYLSIYLVNSNYEKVK